MLHPATDPGFLIGFPCGGIGVGSILIDPTFGKRPVAISGAHQEELGFTVAQPITDRGHVNAPEIRRRTKAGTAKVRMSAVQGQRMVFGSEELRQASHPSVCCTPRREGC